MEESKSSFLGAINKALSVSVQKGTLYLEKLPAGSSALKQRIHELFSKDMRTQAFDILMNITAQTPKQDYLDSVLFAGRFLLGNNLVNECYIFLTVCDERMERVYGSPKDFALMEEIGNMFYLTGQCYEAIKWYEKLMDMNEAPESRMYFNIGMCYLVMQNYTQAIEAFLKSTSADPKFNKSWVNLGYCYLQIGNPDKAISSFKQLPLSCESLTCTGNAYFQLGNYEEAIAHYLRAVEIKEESGTYNNLGAALKKVGLFQDAIYAFTDSLSVHPNSEAASNLATLYIEVGKVEEARVLLRSCYRLLSQSEVRALSRYVEDSKDNPKISILGSISPALIKKNISQVLPSTKGSLKLTQKKNNLISF